jgi:hypothetical protein
MAEFGLVGFAKVALDVARSVLPDYRSKFSKHVFTQPQLLAIVCPMRYEGWTLRKAEVRLAEHRELREALGLDTTPDYTRDSTASSIGSRSGCWFAPWVRP